MPDTTGKKTWKEIGAKLARSLHMASSLSPEIQKAMNTEIGNFEDIIEDLWQNGEMHRNPTREEIPSGPAESASGAGGARMVEHYAHPAPQHGVVEQYRAFSRMLFSLKADMDAVKSVLHDLIKADETPPKEGNALIEKAKEYLKKARMLVVKAEMSDDDEDEEDVGDQIEKALRILKSAKMALLKANEDEEEDEKREDEVEKALDTVRALKRRLTKASEDYRIRIEKAAADKEAAKAAKIAADAAAKAASDAAEKAVKDAAEAAAKAAAAKGEDKGNQADKTDGATGNQDDEAAKAAKAKALADAEAAKAEAAKAANASVG
ncbi:MAG: hypothetical protein ACYDB1_13660, partial [Acidiferrobacteraceae bacterium]